MVLPGGYNRTSRPAVRPAKNVPRPATISAGVDNYKGVGIEDAGVEKGEPPVFYTGVFYTGYPSPTMEMLV